jgi:hypothetical protein
MNISAALQVEITEFRSATARRARNLRPIGRPLGHKTPKLISVFCAGLERSRRARVLIDSFIRPRTVEPLGCFLSVAA